ncbi:hypothetical protein CesoFtcFv8_017103 [Champsocephalus esox]|uniref:Uncharacterized protein n=1 Tax=Champsocephalus esox TaxID=159716 RepID=A0AAN8GNI8_9TELE|nr:hypothetical protein CesoFtcFv8_017103 [Champsocephalus esox]
MGIELQLGWSPLTPGCHDYPERAGWRSERRARLLLGGLLEFSSGMPPKPRPLLGGDVGEGGGSWESGGASLTPIQGQSNAPPVIKTKRENPTKPSAAVFVVGSTRR